MKKIVSLLLLLALALSLSACQGGGSEPTPPAESTPAAVALGEYKGLVAECNEAIMEEAVLLSNMGKWEHNYWKALGNVNGTMDYENMAAKAIEWLNEEAGIEDGTLEANYSSVCDQYKEIVETACDADVEEIDAALEALFNSFDSFYLLVTSPSGDIDTFADDFNRLSKEIKDGNSVLSTLTSD